MSADRSLPEGGHVGAATDIATLVRDNAAAFPDQKWVVSPETGASISWAALHQHAQDIAAQLDALGLSAGAPVAVASHNCLGACLSFVGITFGGYLATPLNLVAGAKVLSYVLDHSKAEVIICAAESRAMIDEIAAASDRDIRIIALDSETGPAFPDQPNIAARSGKRAVPEAKSPALLMYTSGTTGNPKGVVLNHHNLIAAGTNVVVAHGVRGDDTGLCVLPIYHINGLCVTVMGTLVSASQLVMPYKFSVSGFWGVVKAHSVSWFSAVPTLFAYLLNDDGPVDIDRDRLRFSRSASAPLSPEIHRKFEDRFGIPIIETMGLTETGAQILSNPMPPATRKIGSPGIAFGNEVIIGDEAHQEVGRGVTGEILIRGDNVMQGYLHQPEETAKAITADGWLCTGDLGHMDEDGFVFVTGRIKELIIKGGENIAPREVDEVLLEHDCVLEAAAFAVACDNYGQRVEACIRLKPGKVADDDDLRRHCIERLGKFKAPDAIHVLDDLPKGPSGKVQRLKLNALVYG
ncbi:AMP-binding protein [Alphaproteobacteria bacterium]|nr:AMP-binding protein [Alphaproteobacteria bacterium]